LTPDDLLFHQLGQHAEPEPDARGEQPLLRRPDQLTQRFTARGAGNASSPTSLVAT